MFCKSVCARSLCRKLCKFIEYRKTVELKSADYWHKSVRSLPDLYWGFRNASFLREDAIPSMQESQCADGISKGFVQEGYVVAKNPIVAERGGALPLGQV